jgi:A/G-specific adenine glycosylase
LDYLAQKSFYMQQNSDSDNFSVPLLDWFDKHGRKELPWQQNKSVYTVWISEIMLQQTQVNTVIPFFHQFILKFPTLESLAFADIEDILHQWSGLGYYSRARNLYKTAVIIKQDFQGLFPDTMNDLVKLPGIGRSTAGAILSLALNQHQPILDGNVKRILSRYFMVEGWPGSMQVINQLWGYAECITPAKRCADFNQAMMDLGSSVCSRTKPDCAQCPLNFGCSAYKENKTAFYPQPKPRKALPEKNSFFLIITTAQHEILLEKREEKGLWGSLWSFPQVSTTDELEGWLIEHQLVKNGSIAYWESFRHTFSHFNLQIKPIHIMINQPLIPLDLSKFYWHQVANEIKLGVPAPVKKLFMHFSDSLI